MIPKDPVMLLSYINTQLRDHYPSLDELCRELQVNSQEICSQLEKIDYVYDPKTNQFQ